MATSYTNPGGSGDRRSLITPSNSTDSVWFDASYATKFLTNKGMLDGTTTSNGGGISPIFANARATANEWLKFDFGVGASKIIDEAKWYQSSTPAQTHGVWKWQGSNDDSAWTDIGGTFTLGGAAVQTQTTLNGNTTGYRYYRILGVSGTTSFNTYNDEYEFKIEDAVSFTPRMMLLGVG